MGRAIAIGLVFILVLGGLAVLFTQETGTGVPAIQPAGNNDSHSYTVPSADDPVGTQIAAQATSSVGNAQATAASDMVTSVAQSTQEAQAAAAAAAEATRQAQIAATASVEAAAEATKRAEIAATSVAIEEMVVAATIEAGKAQSTATAQAQATGAAIVVAEATSAARERATATAVVVAPTTTVIAADTSAYVTEKTWQERTIPWATVGKALFWSALGLLTVLACAWVFPRAYIALQMRFLRVNNEADGPEWMVVGNKGFIKAWFDAVKITPYNSDRDRGPGQTIDPDRAEGLLPGSDPNVTRRDQATQGMARPVLAATRTAIPSRIGRSLTQTPGILGADGRALTGPRRSYSVLHPGAPLPPAVQKEIDNIVLQQLDKDWEAG